MQKFRLLPLLVGCACCIAAMAQPSKPIGKAAKMKAFIDNLMKLMTLEKKLGQLNLPGAGDITTSQAGNTDIAGKIREGKVGGLFNIKGVEKIT